MVPSARSDGLAQGRLGDLRHDSRGPRLRDDSLPPDGHPALGPHPEPSCPIARSGGSFPKNRYLSILVALVGGAFVPICECGTVPLARRLRQKGLPLSTAVAFLLAAPLANPMTIVSTFVAFKGTGYPVFAYRLGFGLAAAFVIAVIVELVSRRRPSDRHDAAARRSRVRAARGLGLPRGAAAALVAGEMRASRSSARASSRSSRTLSSMPPTISSIPPAI